MHARKDVRYSKEHKRFSFDVDVHGPFIDKRKSRRRRTRMRNVGTQVMMVDEVTQDNPIDWEEIGSQTDFPDWWSDEKSIASGGAGGVEKSGKRRSRSHSRGSSQGEIQQGAGDASSSSASHASDKEYADRDKDWDEKDRDKQYEDGKSPEGGAGGASGGAKRGSRGSAGSKSITSSMRAKAGSKGSSGGKTLERKESKRREAETMARPRGYRELNLKEQAIIVTHEAETNVTSHDIDKEEARKTGHALAKDNILWPTCQSFDATMAVRKIEDYIKRCWTLDPKWQFVVQPSEVYHDNFKRKYVYEVKFSVPTPTTPVPPATASVFFVLEVPLSSAKDEQVRVTYVVEGTRFPHKPGKIPFQDKWLQAIVSDKLRIQKLINF